MVIGSPLKSVMSQVLQNFVPSSGLIAIDNTLASLGLRSRRGRSSANALPWVGAFVRIPSAVPQRLGSVGGGPVRQVPDQRSGYWAIGRIEFRGTDPDVHAVDAPIGHLNNFSTNYAVMSSA